MMPDVPSELLYDSEQAIQALLAEAVLGKDAEDFFASELGRYLVGCCAQERQDALEELANTSSLRIFKCWELRRRAWQAQMVVKWLGDLVVRGKAAMSMLKQREDDNDDTQS